MKKINLILIIILILLSLIFIVVACLEFSNDSSSYLSGPTIRGVVVKVYDKSLTVLEEGTSNSLISLGFTEEGNIGFKQGQEVLIYHDGTILESYPAQLGKVYKIEIIKEKSDIEIPVDVLRFCYSSPNNVNVNVSELTDSGITLTITDTNEIPYEFSHSYLISKKDYNPTDIVYKYTPGTVPDPVAEKLDRKAS